MFATHTGTAAAMYGIGQMHSKLKTTHKYSDLVSSIID